MNRCRILLFFHRFNRKAREKYERLMQEQEMVRIHDKAQKNSTRLVMGDREVIRPELADKMLGKPSTSGIEVTEIPFDEEIEEGKGREMSRRLQFILPRADNIIEE